MAKVSKKKPATRSEKKKVKASKGTKVKVVPKDEAPAKKKKPATARELTRAEKGMTLTALIKNTPAYVKSLARDTVTLKKLQSAKTKGGHHAIKGVCKSDKGEGSGRPHKCSVIGLDKDQDVMSKQKRVIVSCECEFFLFYCEYALTTWGAARIKYSNGEPATVRNPANVPLVCKHLVKLLRAVKEHGY